MWLQWYLNYNDLWFSTETLAHFEMQQETQILWDSLNS